MLSEKVMFALNNISDGYLDEAAEYVFESKGGRGRKAVRIVLIAAVIASLLMVTAYVAGWFGLGSHIVGDAELVRTGVTDSPAGKAYAEWAAFYPDYLEKYLHEMAGKGPVTTDFLSESVEMNAAYNIYMAPDRTSAEKLIEIADKYAVRLHTGMLPLFSWTDFSDASGVSPFSEGCEDRCKRYMLYEDGSFELHCTADAGGKEYAIDIFRDSPDSMQVFRQYRELVFPEYYAEWQFTNKLGQKLILDLAKDDRHYLTSGNSADAKADDPENKMYRFFMFYHTEEWNITAAGFLKGSRTHEYSPEEYKPFVEQIADGMDFEALCLPAENIGRYVNAAPEALKTDRNYFTYTEFMDTPEMRAAGELADWFEGEYLPAFREKIKGKFGAYVPVLREILYKGGDAEIDSKLKELCDKYELTAPEEAFEVFKGNIYRYIPGNFSTGSVSEENLVKRINSPDEIFEFAGQGDFGQMIGYFYDTGAFRGSAPLRDGVLYTYCYIPEGALPTMLPGGFPAPDKLATQWLYKNNSGDVVQIVKDGYSDEHDGLKVPGTDNCYIIYRCPHGYFSVNVQGARNQAYVLERIADSFKFSALK